MEFLLTIVYSLAVIAFIRWHRYFRIEGISRTWIVGAFALKIAAGTGLYLLYTYYYTERNTSDIYKYFDDSRILYDAFWTNPLDFFKIMFSIGNNHPYFDRYYSQMNNWYGIYPTNLYGDGHMMIRFNALARFISFQYLNVHTVIMNFLSFAGLIGIFKFLKPSVGRQKALFLLIFLMPSLLFWGSGVLKEGLILFSIGLSLFHLRKIAENRQQWWRIVLILFGLAILRYTKFYIFAFILPLMIAWLWVNFSRPGFTILKYLIILTFAIAIGSQAYRLNPHNAIPQLLSKKHNGFVALAKDNHAGSQFSHDFMEASWPSVVKTAIPGFFNSLFRPFPWDSLNPLSLVSSIENLFILLLIGFSLIYKQKPEDLKLFYFSLFLFLFIYTVSGQITPVSGALVRYKVVGLPFLMYLVSEERVLQIVKRFKWQFP